MFAALFDSLPVAVILVSTDGRIDRLNARAQRLVREAGLTADSDFGRSLANFPHSERPCLTVETSEGPRLFGFQTSQLEDGGKLIAFQDITRLEQAQVERNRLLQLASISEVMPAVLHELKNPLASIALSLELLIEDSTGPMQQQLHCVLGEVRRLGLTLDGLGRFREEVRSTRHHALDLALREAFSLLEPQAAARHITATLDVPDMPLLPFEPAAVRAVLFNLVTNSIHACQAGQRIEVKARFERDEPRLVLEVFDTGIGMRPEVLARCTELFFTTKARGSGIGLALCAGVAATVGGSLNVESRSGEGTHVTLTFPVVARSTA